VTAAITRPGGPKGRILDHARELFFRYGFTRVTIDEIAADLHISKTTFYRFFRSKEALLAEAIRVYYRRIRDGVSDIMADNAGGYLESLTNVLLYIREMLERIDARARQDIHTNAPGIWKSLQDLKNRMVHAALEKVLEEGMGSKIIRPDIDARRVASVLIMAFEHALDSEVLRPLSLSAEDAFQTLVDVFLGGLLTDARRLPGKRRPFATESRSSK